MTLSTAVYSIYLNQPDHPGKRVALRQRYGRSTIANTVAIADHWVRHVRRQADGQPQGDQGQGVRQGQAGADWSPALISNNTMRCLNLHATVIAM
jgi:hypothetical protein